MSNYNPAIAWAGKDSLSDSDPEKVISGADFNTEFTTVQTAINSKANLNGSAAEAFSASTPIAGDNTTKVATTAFLETKIANILLDEDDLVSDSDTKVATQQSIKAYIDAQIAGQTIQETNVTTGVANHGDTLPIPSGYTDAQCEYIVSINYTTSDVPSGKSQDGIYITCSVNASRVVTMSFANNQGSGPHYGSVNWMCVAIK